MINKEDILQAVKLKGYVIPSDLSKQFTVDTFIMGAVLSDLVSEKKLFVSSVKIGGTPVYYIPEAREKLQELFKYLNEKDKQTYQLLQEKLVLVDTAQTPLVRVSLRNIKDFSKPIEVTAQGTTQLFWKWYLASDEEVNQKIHSFLTPMQESVQEKVEIKKEIKLEVKPEITLEVPEKKIIKKEIIKKDKQQSLSVIPDDAFVQSVSAFFTQKAITLSDIIVVKKGEIECIAHIPSSIGVFDYYCKAKNKKKCTEGEIASAFVAAQLKKLPALFLIPGEIPKKLKMQDYPNMKILTMEGF
ncbi:MAG: hypothetical protein WC254_02685 [Candidatus Woesearchaeota archaeon]|jgi:hypothetical protein